MKGLWTVVKRICETRGFQAGSERVKGVMDNENEQSSERDDVTSAGGRVGRGLNPPMSGVGLG